jgi:hypothetical protein
LCSQSGGLWSFDACECLCCGSGCTAEWNGTNPVCKCGGVPLGNRTACISPSHQL